MTRSRTQWTTARASTAAQPACLPTSPRLVRVFRGGWGFPQWIFTDFMGITAGRPEIRIEGLVEIGRGRCV